MQSNGATRSGTARTGVTKQDACRVRGQGRGPGLREVRRTGLREDRPVTLPSLERTEWRDFFP